MNWKKTVIEWNKISDAKIDQGLDERIEKCAFQSFKIVEVDCLRQMKRS